MNLHPTILVFTSILIITPIKKSEQTYPFTRIIGGTTASVENYPFVACIIIKIRDPELVIFSGGGAIIGKFWAITAAHCVYDFNDGIISAEQGYVRSNTTYWEAEGKGKRDHLIIQYIIHEAYQTDLEDNDIALIKVSEAFDGAHEKPILFTSNNYVYKAKSVATTMGWGTTKPNVDPHTVSELRQVDINIVDQNKCSDLFLKNNLSFSSRMMCCSAPDRDACINDSGGPLIQFDNAKKRVTLIGIVSWGVDCASDEFPGVYVKLSKFSTWIRNRLGTGNRIFHKCSEDGDDKNCTSNDSPENYEL